MQRAFKFLGYLALAILIFALGYIAMLMFTASEENQEIPNIQLNELPEPYTEYREGKG